MSKIKKRAESSAKKATDSAKSQNLEENISSLRDSAKQNRGKPHYENIAELQSGLPRRFCESARNDEFLDSAESQNLNKNNLCEAPKTRPLRGAKNREQGRSSASADFLLEAESRGTPPKSEKAAAFWRVGGAGRGVQPFLREESSKISCVGVAESTLDSAISQGGLPRRFCESARNDEIVRDSSLRKCSAQNDKLKKNAESRVDSAKPQNLVKKQSRKPLKSALDSVPKKILDSAPRTQNALDSATLSQAQADLDALQKKIRYYFRDENLLRKALTHKSFDKHANNERLEFLGDAVMDLIIGEYVFRTQERGNEGDLTRIRAAMVNENSLANLANSINLGKYLFISFSENRNKGRKKPSILSDAFEALMGAIYLDGGLESARAVAHNLLENEYREVEIESLFVDYKSALQELTQAICGNLPKYVLLKSSGPDHSKKFTMQVLINGEKFATARGKSKKEAEQECAKIAYNRIKKEAI